jgi:HSP20 family protein
VGRDDAGDASKCTRVRSKPSLREGETMTTLARRRSTPIADLLEWLESGAGVGIRGLGHTPHVRVEDYIENGTYVLRAEMPGIDPDKDVELTIEHGQLIIRGERREEKQDKNRQEFQYGAFSRSVPLPADLTPAEIQATYIDGVLEVRVPVAKAESKTVKVPVQRPEGA